MISTYTFSFSSCVPMVLPIVIWMSSYVSSCCMFAISNRDWGPFGSRFLPFLLWHSLCRRRHETTSTGSRTWSWTHPDRLPSYFLWYHSFAYSRKWNMGRSSCKALTYPGAMFSAGCILTALPVHLAALWVLILHLDCTQSGLRVKFRRFLYLRPVIWNLKSEAPNSQRFYKTSSNFGADITLTACWQCWQHTDSALSVLTARS